MEDNKRGRLIFLCFYHIPSSISFTVTLEQENSELVEPEFCCHTSFCLTSSILKAKLTDSWEMLKYFSVAVGFEKLGIVSPWALFLHRQELLN